MNLLVRGPRPAEASHARAAAGGSAEVKLPAYERGQKVATRKAYGDALAALGRPPRRGGHGRRGEQLDVRR